ncbi:MAG TPA: kelch repeat-containing protein [Candidatus Limnocylindrales bacterium]|nr:kelch repeat-containing protein [Candidatus Limnocylindrales bacterium]
MCHLIQWRRLSAWYRDWSWLRLVLLAGLLISWQSKAAGTWVPLTNQAPDNIDTMLLLSDGTVMAASGEPGGGGTGNAWYRLTPDANGSYVNGIWSTLAPMNYTRLYYSSQVLQNGRVLVAGGEYGSGSNSAEIYDPVANTWTVTPPPPAGQVRFHDSVSEIISNGNVLVAPVTPAAYGETVIYNIASNVWMVGPTLANNNYYQDEASWVKLPDNSILTIDPFGTNSERYIPSLNQWISDATVPVAIYDPVAGEMGAAFLLPDGRAFFLGGTGNTVLYTPSGNTNAGVWQAGPVIPNGQVAADAPGAMMVNGKILCATASSATNTVPTSFYEYDPVANAFTQVNGPAGLVFYQASFAMRMLDLPDGTALFSDTGPQLYVYQPDGSPLAAGKPAITALATNGDGSYHLTGTLFNGISEGAAYGDDAQMSSDYPLVRLTNSAGNVYYARTYNWSSTSVMTGTNPVSTDFTLPANLPQGIYSLVAVANGNASAPVTFVYSSDALFISYTNSLLFTGTAGGPFTPASITLTLTNVGASSLNWSLGNTSSWLNASVTSGSLTPGGPAANVAVSLNSTATNLPFDTYTAVLWFTNLTDHFVQSRSFTLQASPPQLVQNGGFETGDFTDWTQSGNIDSYETVVTDPAFIHSGNYGAKIGPGGSLYYLTQTLPTAPGQLYLISFWLVNYNGDGPNQFLADWGATTLFNQINMPLTSGWTNLQYLVTAPGTSTVLQFGFRNDPYYFAFDDITVTAVRAPAFQALAKSGGSVNFTWTAISGLSYQLQYKTNLIQTSWINLGGVINATTNTVTATDAAPTDPQRFYRIEMLP